MTNKNNNNPKQIKVKMKEEVAEGVYANAMAINHTKEEFVLDFMKILPPNGVVAARVITSPGHFKRMIKAMQESLKGYEKSHGNVEEAEGVNDEIGFKDK